MIHFELRSYGFAAELNFNICNVVVNTIKKYSIHLCTLTKPIKVYLKTFELLFNALTFTDFAITSFFMLFIKEKAAT